MSHVVQADLDLEALRAQLIAHPLYAAVDTPERLATFMESHVFAVWDFMTLLKSLQRRLTSIDLPWLPPDDVVAARLLNSIVLAEESDELPDGTIISHFELYLRAMREVGSSTAFIDQFVESLREGMDPGLAMRHAGVPDDVRRFVDTTLEVAMGGTNEEVAAFFLHGREDPIPAMFKRLLETVPAESVAMRTYLERHVEVDGDEHGPLAAKLLERLVAAELPRVARAGDASRRAIEARIALWDGLHARIAASLTQ